MGRRVSQQTCFEAPACLEVINTMTQIILRALHTALQSIGSIPTEG
jgi:hypothetical protein